MSNGITRTLGGDRLGSGKKMNVHLHGYERSTHDIGYLFRTTMSAGTLVPFLWELGLPGTTMDINIGMDVKTHPTVGPLFGSYKAQVDIFVIPVRLYNAQLHNNTLGIGRNMSQIKLPQIEMTATGVAPSQGVNVDNAQVNPSSLPAYFGLRGVGRWDGVGDAPTRQFNAICYLAYWETYKNYYANKQEEIGAVIHTTRAAASFTITSAAYIYTGGSIPLVQVPPGALGNVPVVGSNAMAIIGVDFTGTFNQSQMAMYTNYGTLNMIDLGETAVIVAGNAQMRIRQEKYPNLVLMGYTTSPVIVGSKPEITTFGLSNIDDMRKYILSQWDTVGVVINDADLVPYKYLYEQVSTVPNILSSQEGLALKTYQNDLFNNWLKTENIEAISVATAIDTSSGEFTIDAFIISKKVWEMLNRINVSGGSYDDWQDAVYVHERYRQTESPIYVGGLIKELVFQEVVSNTETASQPLGTLAGKGVMASKHKGGHVVVHIDEPSYVMGLVSLTPRVDYSQGNSWDVNLKTVDDFHKPALDQIGFQELITEQLHWAETEWNGLIWVTQSAGKQPAWINYMTNVNRVRGNFAIEDNEMFMVLNRRYNMEEEGIADLTTYIDPSKFNFIFAETQLDAQNFWTQISVDIEARRKMSGKLMPNI